MLRATERNVPTIPKPPQTTALLATAIAGRIDSASRLRSRLLLVVGPPGSGKSAALATVHARTGRPLLNVGLELSRPMLEIAADQRPLQVRPLLEQLVDAAAGRGGDVVLLDNTEVLFEASLRQDTLRLLQGVARNATVVAAWTGEVKDGALRYAVPGHAEHRRYPAEGLLIVNVETGVDAP